MNHTPHQPTASAPLGIWPCDPAPEDGDQLPELAERVTPALLRRVLAEYSPAEDTVALVGIDPAALPTAGRDGDFDFAAAAPTGPAAPTTPPLPGQAAYTASSGEQSAIVGLIVAVLADPGGCDPGIYAQWRRRLRPGGALVALAACPAGAVTFANNAGLIVAGATAAGFDYQQHIVAIHARMANDQLLAPPGQLPIPGTAGTAVQQPVHSDVLVFTNPGPVDHQDTAGGAR